VAAASLEAVLRLVAAVEAAVAVWPRLRMPALVLLISVTRS
jgi:hypothetical protein